jgi:hypothetical protein
MSILAIYKEQDDIIESVQYTNYLKYLELYYDNTEKSSKYIKSIDENGNYKLTDKKNKANVITIEKSQIINLNSYYDNLNIKVNNIYNSISELISDIYNDDSFKKKEFEKLKDEYKSIILNLNDIKNIFKIQSSKLFKLNEEKINFEIQLANIYINRKKLFKNIKPVNKESKKLIYNTYKNNMKIPSEEEIKSLSTKIKLTSSETKEWFKWMNESYLYINYQLKINKLTLLIKEHTSKNDKTNKNFIIHKPDFNEKKKVDL